MKLYAGTKNASSWAMRAWLALVEAGVQFEEEIIDIRRPQRFVNLDRIGAFSAQRTVPVLDVSGTIISDSLAIMEFANDACGGKLLPEDLVLRAQARALLAWQHAGLSGICARISFESSFYSSRRALTDAENAECGRIAAHLSQCLATSNGDYLFGRLSLADLALVPTVIRMSRHGWSLGGLPQVQTWVQGLLARSSVREWLTEADRLPPIWYDEYLVPYVRPKFRAASR